ncbi:MAG: hypothetical protein ACRDT0_09320 [Pseudonocardiaceae bacterium]
MRYARTIAHSVSSPNVTNVVLFGDPATARTGILIGNLCEEM